MKLRNVTASAAVSSLVLCASCVQPGPAASGTRSAVILGQLVTNPDNAKLFAQLSAACPEISVTVNGGPASIEFDDECGFAITDIQPAPLLEIRVELPALGIAGTVEITDVLDGELIEILVEPGDDSLTVSIERRATPEPSDVLPELIEGNNVSIELPAGVFDQGLTVKGNHFTLVGEAGEGCGDQEGWTVITGPVLIEGNKATFRNIYFAGPIEIRGNKAHFINCCFGDGLVVFGNKAEFDDGDNDEDDDKGKD